MPSGPGYGGGQPGRSQAAKVRELLEQRSCEVLCLPPYSPDYNPTGEAFSRVENPLKKAAARAEKALGAALSAVPTEDAPGSSSTPDTVRRLSYCETCRRFGTAEKGS